MADPDNVDMSSTELDPLLLKAVDWMLLLESGQATVQDQENFQQWLQQEVKHQQAWQELQESVHLPFEQLQQQSLDAQVPIEAVSKTVLKPKKQRRGLMLGSSTFVLLGIVGSLIWLQQIRPLSFWQADYYTQTGERKKIRLEDGSIIYLNAYSAVKVKYSAHSRDVYLLNGALIADVEADRNRPFTVRTHEGQMQALGTRFMVQQHTDYSDLAVLQHTVQASNQQTLAVVEQGQAVRVNQYEIQSLPETATDLASWQQGVLQVQDMPLDEFIQQLKPYHHGYIYLSEQAKQQKVYGVFYLKDTDKILEILQSTLPLKISRIGSTLVYIDKPYS